MERARKTHWLVAQGYHLSTIPPVVTWYATDAASGMYFEKAETQGATQVQKLLLLEVKDSNNFLRRKSIYYENRFNKYSPNMHPKDPHKIYSKTGHSIKMSAGDSFDPAYGDYQKNIKNIKRMKVQSRMNSTTGMLLILTVNLYKVISISR